MFCQQLHRLIKNGVVDEEIIGDFHELPQFHQRKKGGFDDARCPLWQLRDDFFQRGRVDAGIQKELLQCLFCCLFLFGELNFMRCQAEEVPLLHQVFLRDKFRCQLLKTEFVKRKLEAQLRSVLTGEERLRLVKCS